MRFSLIRITAAEKRHYLAVFRQAFSIGGTAENEFVFNHPALAGASLKVRKGRFQFPGAPPPGFSLEKGDRFLRSDGLGIRIHSFRIALILCLLTAIVASCCVIRHVLAPARGRPPVQDWSPVRLPSAGTYGNCSLDRNHPLGAVFSFSTPPDLECLVRFTLGGEGKGSVAILIDGDRLAGDLPLPLGWGAETVLPVRPAVPARPHRLLEVKVEGDPPGAVVPWGIEGVRISPVHSREVFLRSGWRDIREILTDPFAGACELASLYRKLKDALPTVEGDGERLKAEEGIRILEGRMKTLLEDTLVRYRSLISTGRGEEAEMVRTEMRRWLPPDWREGWRILDGRLARGG